MATRGGFFEGIADTAARLPWPVPLGLALGWLVVLHIIAASLWQIVVPMVLLATALLCFSRQHARRAVELAGDTPAAAVDGLSWREFERLIGLAFQRRGYQVEPAAANAGDVGVDLELTLDGERFFVQCKQWQARKVNAVSVRELCGIMAARAAVGGFIITSGSFSADARSFAEHHNVELIDGVQLNSMIAMTDDEGCDTQRVAIIRALDMERQAGRD